MVNKVKIRNAVLVGLIPSILEGILIYSVDPSTKIWILLQSVLAWFSFGFVVYLIKKGKRIVINSILLSILLCLPWYIAESIAKDMPEHLVPLIIASIVMGIVIGLVSKWIDKKLAN